MKFYLVQQGYYFSIDHLTNDDLITDELIPFISLYQAIAFIKTKYDYIDTNFYDLYEITFEDGKITSEKMKRYDRYFNKE